MTTLELMKMIAYTIIIVACLMVIFDTTYLYFESVKVQKDSCDICCARNPGFECEKPKTFNISMPNIQGGIK